MERVQATLLPMFFAVDSGMLECTVEPKDFRHFGSTLNVSEKDQFRAVIGLKDDVLRNLTGYVDRFSEERKSRFKGAFFVNKDIADPVLAIPVPLSSMNFVAMNFDRLARGDLTIEFSVEINAWEDDGNISTACEFIRTANLRIKTP